MSAGFAPGDETVPQRRRAAIYFKQDTALPPFIPLPQFLLNGDYSLNATLLYGLLLNRTILSQKNGWVNEQGNVYVIYPIKQMANDLNRSERTVKTALCELENAGLLKRVRQGWNQANKLYVRLPDMVQEAALPEGKACPMEVQEAAPCRGQSLPTSHTEPEYTDRSQKKGEGTRRCFGEFQNVFLSPAEYSALQADFGARCGDYIDRLSRYMAANDRHYANHCAVIRKWLAEDHRGKAAGTYTYDEHNEGDCL